MMIRIIYHELRKIEPSKARELVRGKKRKSVWIWTAVLE